MNEQDTREQQNKNAGQTKHATDGRLTATLYYNLPRLTIHSFFVSWTPALGKQQQENQLTQTSRLKRATDKVHDGQQKTMTGQDGDATDGQDNAAANNTTDREDDAVDGS
jgi:hypothetical protein